MDFEVDELVGLVKALFSETPLRASTIAKISASGKPVMRSPRAYDDVGDAWGL